MVKTAVPPSVVTPKEKQLTKREQYASKLLETIRSLQRAVAQRDERDVLRMIRRLSALRQTTHMSLFKAAFQEASKLGVDSQAAGPLLALIEALQDLDVFRRKEVEPEIPVTNTEDVDMTSDGDAKPTETPAQETPAQETPANEVEAAKKTAGDEDIAEKPGDGETETPVVEKSFEERLMEALGDDKRRSVLDYLRLWFCTLLAFATVDGYVLTSRLADIREVEKAKAILSKAGIVCDELITCIKMCAERSSDLLDAKAYFALSRLRNLRNERQEWRIVALQAYRVATLERKPFCQATLINQLLQSYIDAAEFDLAIKFITKATFPEQIRATAEVVRCLFNLGRIQAVRLEYSDAHEKILAAVRKLPPNESFARGFKVLAYKHAIVVELLMGDIPEVTIFRKGMKSELAVYEKIVHAVRQGDLQSFEKLLLDHGSEFQKDGTLFLVERLRHSVIKTGLRKLNLSYSRISLEDIASRLGLGSARDVESILSKAIKDGVVSGTIDISNSCLISKSTVERHKSAEPAETFHKRIEFCTSMHQDAMKAIQYPEEDSLKARALEIEKRRRDQQEEMSKAQESFDEDEDDMF